MKDIKYIIPISRKEKTTPRTLPRKIWKRPRSGVECMFIHLEKKVGIKIYPDKEAAETAWGNQKRAADAKVAPKVLSSIMTCDPKNICKIDKINTWSEFTFKDRVDARRRPCYFFKTQVAQVKGDKGFRFTIEEQESLENEIDALDLSSTDMHEWNVGRINGRLVCIDFGPEST